MKQKILLGALSVMSFASLHTYVEIETTGRSAPEVTFSNSAYNRVSYKEGGIKSVVGNKNELDVNLNSGVAFIKPKLDVKGPFTITVITSDDEAQDLQILVADKAAEHVRLIDSVDETDKLLEKLSTVNFLNALIEGRCPETYKENPSAHTEKYELPDPLECNYIKSYEGQTETIHVYRIANNSRKKDFVLSSSLFKNSRNLWVFLTTSKLLPKDSGFCFVSIPKKGVLE